MRLLALLLLLPPVLLVLWHRCDKHAAATIRLILTDLDYFESDRTTVVQDTGEHGATNSVRLCHVLLLHE